MTRPRRSRRRSSGPRPRTGRTRGRRCLRRRARTWPPCVTAGRRKRIGARRQWATHADIADTGPDHVPRRASPTVPYNQAYPVFAEAIRTTLVRALGLPTRVFQGLEASEFWNRNKGDTRTRGFKCLKSGTNTRPKHAQNIEKGEGGRDFPDLCRL